MQQPDRQFITASLERSPVFGSLSEEARADLARRAVHHRYAVRTLLKAPGEPLGKLWLVQHGQIELTAGSREGMEVTLTAMGPGAWATWLGLFHREAATHAFYAAPRSLVISWDTGHVRSIIAAHPHLYPAVIGEIGERFAALIDWIEQAALSRGEHRLAKLLQLLARMSGDGCTIRLSHERLARLAGCSRQSLHDRLQQLRTLNLICQRYGRIEVIDGAGLAALCGEVRG